MRLLWIYGDNLVYTYKYQGSILLLIFYCCSHVMYGLSCGLAHGDNYSLLIYFFLRIFDTRTNKSLLWFLIGYS